MQNKGKLQEVTMNSRIPSLDGLRGIAAWLVILSHTNNAIGRKFLFVSGAGQTGVMLFFVLSGFLMAYLYFDRELNDIPKYVTARIARIFPLYFLVVMYSLLCQEGYLNIPVHSYKVNFANIYDHVFFVEGQNVLWTIPVEVTFYLVFILIWLTRSSSKPAYVSAIILLFLFPILTNYSPLPTGHRLPEYIAFFLVGIVVAESYLDDSKLPGGQWPLVLFLFMVVGIIILIPGNYRALFKLGMGGYKSHNPLLISGAVLACACYSKVSQNVLGHSFFSIQGRISYSLYLLHPIVIYTLKRNFGIDDWKLFIYVIPITFILSYLSFNFFEKPLGKRIRTFYPVIFKTQRKVNI